jgi:hypothetical protein
MSLAAFRESTPINGFSLYETHTGGAKARKEGSCSDSRVARYHASSPEVGRSIV